MKHFLIKKIQLATCPKFLLEMFTGKTRGIFLGIFLFSGGEGGGGSFMNSVRGPPYTCRFLGGKLLHIARLAGVLFLGT